MIDLIQKVKRANTPNEELAAKTALIQHSSVYGNVGTRKRVYHVEVAGKAYQIEVVSAKKYMIAEVRNCHRRLNKVCGEVV